MKLFVGLGNPGISYEKTRHNAGFMVMDEIAKKTGIVIEKKQFEALTGTGFIRGEKVLLMKPETFMNSSGIALFQAMQYYKLSAKDIVVIYDDIDLDIGHLRLRQKGSAGGHNGIKSIQEALLGQEFNRIRVGVGKDQQIPIIKWVLSKFKEDELKALQPVLSAAADAAIASVDTDFVKVMNQFNGVIQ